jgi:hypothetical protein
MGYLDKLSLPGRRERVLHAAQGRVEIEFGTVADVHAAPRVAILAHFSDGPRVSRSLRTLVRQFADADYVPVVVSGSPVRQPLEWNGDRPPTAIVVRQPNLGYDFGSWAIGLDLIGPARSAPNVVLANDSLVGPFTDLGPLLTRFEQTQADVWSLTDTHQYFHHLQSYFLGFRDGVLDRGVLGEFWRNVRIHPNKWEVIRRNELGLSSLLAQECYAVTSAFRADEIVPHGENPVIRGWSKLLENGFPFVKREIVRNPEVAPDGERVAREVELLFGERLEDWL